jgi:hypothetical protein
MGQTVSNIPHLKDDTWWAGPKTQDELVANFPYFPVRMLLLPGWNTKYQRYKTMITSIYGDEDVLHIQDHHDGCQCIIA